ncbi:MAG: SdrD B-like domain-containing protein [Candidatus Kerfeldbacteria bacterium]
MKINLLPHPQKTKRVLYKTLNIIATLALILNTSMIGVFIAPNEAQAAESAKISQCANDPAPSPSTDGCATDAKEWVTGNLGASKSVYYEGDTIPYKMEMGGLTIDSTNNTITIKWDTTKADKHAIDYLTTYNETVLTADPDIGIPGLTPTTYPIPNDPQNSGITQIPGVFTLFGGTITNVGNYEYPDGSGFVGDKTAIITVTFTADVANPVLAWGGHISTREDWGDENSAIAIPGSPYHSSLVELNGSGGSQDLSLSAEAVIYPASITIIKDAIPEGPQSFDYTTTGGLTPAIFSLIDDGTSTNTKTYNDIIDFTTYSITESVIAGWALNNIACTVTTSNGGNQTVTIPTVSINLEEGENVTCTYTNDRQEGNISGYKWKDSNNDGIWQQATEPGLANWTINLGGDATASTTTDSNGLYSFVNLNPGNYTVSETQQTNWIQTYPTNNVHNVTLLAGQNETDVNFGNVPGVCNLVITKTVDKTTASVGDTLEYTLEYINTGEAICTGGGVQLFDNLDPRLTYNGIHTELISGDVDGQGITFEGNFNGSNPVANAHVVSPGESGAVIFQAVITEPLDCDDFDIPNQAWIWSNETGDIYSNIVNTHVEMDCNGNLKVIKVVNGGTALPEDFGFRIVGSGNPYIYPATTSNYVMFNDLTPNDYTVEEEIIPGYSLTNSTCNSVTVTTGNTAECTITNTRNTGDLIIRKVDQAGAPLDVYVTVDGSEFNDNGWTGTNGEYNVGTIPTDIYTVTETSPQGYTVSGWECVLIGDVPQVWNGTGSTINNAEVFNGRTTICTFTNVRDTGDLTVYKNVDTNGDGQVDVFGATNWNWDIQNGEQNIATGSTRTLATDTYTLSEDMKTGYHVTDVTCNGVSYGANESVQVNLTNQGVVCTFTNTRNVGDLRIKKYNDLNGDGIINGNDYYMTGWYFEVKDGSTVVASGTTGQDPQDSPYLIIRNLPTGSYDVVETQQTGWTNTEPGNGTLTKTVTITNGGLKSVWFGNNRDTGEIIVHKNLDTDGNGIVDEYNVDTWRWDIANGEQNISTGQGRTLTTGSYTISEDMMTNYHVTDLTCDGVSYGAVETKTIQLTKSGVDCTFTNTRDTGDIKVNKEIDTNGDGTFESGNTEANNLGFVWGINAETPARAMGSNKTVVTGTYDVTENDGDVANYHFVGWYVNGSDFTCETTTYHSLPANINVSKNDTTEITLCNTRDTGDIKVNKEVDTNGDGTFDGGNTEANALGFVWGIDSETPARDMGSNETVVTGTYDVTENDGDVANYHFVGWYSNTPGANFNCTNLEGITLPININVSKNNTTEITLCNALDTGDLRIKKYNDLNGDGDKDSNEPYMPGWYFEVKDGSTVVASGTTGQDPQDSPYLIIRNLPTGSYDVVETQQTGWTNTEPGNGTLTKTVTITNGDLESVWFGNFKLGEITGQKWNDLNGDGIWNTGEPTLLGWTIQLLADDMSTVLDTDITDSNGRYEFTGLEKGTYYLNEVQQGGWTQTFPGQGQILGPIDVTSGTDVSGYNFGNFDNIYIAGQKFEDINGNGTKDSGETGLVGWTIELRDAQNNVLDITVTNGVGRYSFDDLAPGTYRVREVQQTGWTQTTTNPADIIAVSGQDVDDIDFGNFKDTKISGHKFNDLNGDGVWDAGEPAIAGWTIYISGNWATSTQTLTDGSYEFTGLTAGDWTVTEDESNTAWIRTTSNPAPITITSGSDITDVDFGNYKKGKISGYKFEDVNGNKTWDTGELALAGWTINLDNGSSDVTDANGYYSFTGLQAGDYNVTETLKTGWTQMTTDPATITVVSGTNSQDNNFGNFQLGIITGYKFEDINNNRQWDGQETGLQGWEINLHEDNTGQPGTIIAQTLTNEFGMFEFTGIVAGTYWLSETMQTGWYQYAPVGGVFGPIVIMSGYDNNSQEEYFEFGNAEKITLTLDKYNDQEVAQGGDGILETTETVAYHIDWSVAGNSIATNVVLTDIIPAELNLDVASITSSIPTVTPPKWDDTTRTITWDFGTQQPNASGFVTYTATLNVPVANGTEIINIAKIAADNSDPQYLEDESKVTVKSAPVLTIVKTVEPTTYVNRGDLVTYTVVVTNVGTDTSINTILSDLLPDGFVYEDTGLATREWSLGDMIVGDSITTTYNVLIGSEVDAGFYDNLAITWSDNHPSIDDIATVEVRIPTVKSEEADPVLVIEKTVDKQFINPGDSVVYTVVITNIGDAQAEAVAINVKLQDLLPAGFTFIDGTVTKTFNLGDILHGESKIITYTAISNGTILPGDYENLAVAWADNHGNVTDFANVEVRAPIVLGEELPTTGGSAMQFLYIFAAALILLFSAYTLKLTVSKKE